MRLAIAGLLVLVVCLAVVVVGCGGMEHEGNLPPGFLEPPPGTHKPAGHPTGDCRTCHGPNATSQAESAGGL